MIRKPQSSRVIVLDGSNESDAIRIPRGAVRVAISPRTTTTVRIAFVENLTQDTSQSFQLVSGQSFTFDVSAGDELDEFDLFFFAAAGTTVDLVVW